MLWSYEGKPGRGSDNKVPFVAAVQINSKDHPIAVCFDCVKAFTSEQIAKWSARALDAKAVAVSLSLSLNEKPLKNQNFIG